MQSAPLQVLSSSGILQLENIYLVPWVSVTTSFFEFLSNLELYLKGSSFFLFKFHTSKPEIGLGLSLSKLIFIGNSASS